MDAKELSEQLRKPSGETGKEIGKVLNESNRGLYELAFEMMSLQKDDQVLEIGFGNGMHFPEYFRLQPRISVTGVDFSADMCDEAQQNNQDLIKSGKLSIHCSDTSSLPFQDQMFDLVVLINVIYFLDPPEIHLKEIRRVLKPGGHLLIGYRPRHSIEHLEFTKQNFTLYESDELFSLLETNGYEPVLEESRTYGKESVDGSEFTVKDVCLLAKK